MQIHSKRRKRSNSARKRKHMELRAIASFACKVRVQDLGTRMKRAWSNERRHRSFSLVYVSPKWNFYKLKSFSQNSLYFTSFVRSGRITGPVSIFIMGHFVALCAIRAWRTAFLIPAPCILVPKPDGSARITDKWTTWPRQTTSLFQEWMTLSTKLEKPSM